LFVLTGAGGSICQEGRKKARRQEGDGPELTAFDPEWGPDEACQSGGLAVPSVYRSWFIRAYWVRTMFAAG